MIINPHDIVYMMDAGLKPLDLHHTIKVGHIYYGKAGPKTVTAVNFPNAGKITLAELITARVEPDIDGDYVPPFWIYEKISPLTKGMAEVQPAPLP